MRALVLELVRVRRWRRVGRAGDRCGGVADRAADRGSLEAAHELVSSIATSSSQHQGHAEVLVKVLDFGRARSWPQRARLRSVAVADRNRDAARACVILGTVLHEPGRHAGRRSTSEPNLGVRCVLYEM